MFYHKLTSCYLYNHIFSSGEDIQRASVIINLPILVRQNPAETFRRVVPKVKVSQMMLYFFAFTLVQKLLWLLNADYLWMTMQGSLFCPQQEVLQVVGADMQLAAAGSFLTILQDDIVLIQTHTHSILQIVLKNLDHRDTGCHCLKNLPTSYSNVHMLNLLKFWNKLYLKHRVCFVFSQDCNSHTVHMHATSALCYSKVQSIIWPIV